jgi:hypothetical protein
VIESERFSVASNPAIWANRVTASAGFTITLQKNGATPFQVADIDIIVGKYGDLSELIAYNGATVVATYQVSGATKNGTLSAATNMTYMNYNMNKYNWKLNPTWNPASPDSLVLAQSITMTSLCIRLSPTVIKTTNVPWIFEWAFDDKYTSMADLVAVQAWYRKPKATTETAWNAMSVYRTPVKGNEIIRIPFKDIFSNNKDLVPPTTVVGKDKIKYRIVIGDASGVLGASTLGYDQKASINILNSSGAYLFSYPELTSPSVRLKNTYNQSLQDIWYKDLVDVSTGADKGAMLQVQYDDKKISRSGRYSLKTKVDNNIRLYPCRSNSPDEMWFPIISNGKFFVRSKDGVNTSQYAIPEFATQAFSSKFTHNEINLNPYKDVVFEEAKFINNNQIQVSKYPLYVGVDSNGDPDVNYLIVYKEVDKDKPVEVRPKIPVKDWNPFTGDIYLSQEIESTDVVYVDYIYEVTDYEYKGYYDFANSRFVYLDLNPLPGHKYSDNAGNLRDASELLGKDIYLYIVPAFWKDETGEGNNRTTTRHIIVDAGTPESTAMASVDSKAILLGKILVRNNLSSTEVQIIDTRRRGGGFKESLTKNYIQTVSEDAGQVWDIGSWDGLPYQSNGVVIITLPAELKGQYSDAELNEIINKYIAFGTYPFVRYEDTNV